MPIPMTTTPVPEHLREAVSAPSVEELKAELQAQQAASLTELKTELEEKRSTDVQAAAAAAAKRERYKERIAVIVFSYGEGDRKLEGEFQNRVLNVKERREAGVLRARLAYGIPYDTLDPLTREITLCLSHLETSLMKRPVWAKDLEALDDYEVLRSIYEEVLEHEATFLGR